MKTKKSDTSALQRGSGVLAALALASAFALPVGAVLSAGPPLSLAEAVERAVADDPMLNGAEAVAQALDESAIADGQLPDPQFRFSLFNFPVDTFSRTQEPITQLRFGVSQAIPRGDTLNLRRERTTVKAGIERARSSNERLQIIRSTRTHWLEAYYWAQAETVVRENVRLFKQLVEITESQYAAGKQKQQDVLRAELELGLLDDRLTDIRAKQDSARAMLSKWIGDEAQRPLPATFPELEAMPPKTSLDNALLEHPMLRVEQAKIESTRIGVELAREAYKPAWTLGLDYGIRDGRNPDGSERADFVAATVMLDVPLFTDNRQDRRLRAEQRRASAALLSREDRYRQLQSELGSEYARWERLSERLQLYDNLLLAQARENSEASLNAYQSDATEFTTLMRARITELDARLRALRIRVDRAKSAAKLFYLAGESR